jgi:hypothetical protein
VSTFGVRAPDGSAAIPQISFANDTDCGFYRIGANNVGLALGGAKVVDFATTGVAVTGTLSATGTVTLAASSAANHQIVRSVNDGFTYVSGGTALDAGMNIGLAGGTHATLPNIMVFRQDSLEIGRIANGGIFLWGTTTATGAVAGSVVLGNVNSTPTTPTGGGILYVQSGALKYIGTSGTVTIIAAA